MHTITEDWTISIRSAGVIVTLVVGMLLAWNDIRERLNRIEANQAEFVTEKQFAHWLSAAMQANAASPNLHWPSLPEKQLPPSETPYYSRKD